jgi:hypothetical protein
VPVPGATNTKFAASGLYYGREYQQYEFAIPWSRLGGRPALDERVRIGVYTTGDENVGGLNRSNWDVYDQAPGIGQGCNGLASHERIGDDPFDNDSRLAPFNSDATPYVGRTDGYDGLPNFWQTATTNTTRHSAGTTTLLPRTSTRSRSISSSRLIPGSSIASNVKSRSSARAMSRFPAAHSCPTSPQT